MRKHSFCVLVAFTATVACVSEGRAALLFSNYTDTISVAGNTIVTNGATYEAVVLITSQSYPSSSGNIYNDWQSAAEDEHLYVNDGGAADAYSFPVNSGIPLTGSILSTGVWYDLAYVYNGSQELLYVDGNLTASHTTSGNITGGSNAIAVVGAIFRDGHINQSVLGKIQSLRISDVARYSGNSYTPYFGDFSNDSSTELLYNFDSAPVGGIVTDLSGNGHTGTLGVGFNGATSPAFVAFPEPASLAMIGLAAGACLMRKRRGT